jgi:hypothetical protein
MPLALPALLALTLSGCMPKATVVQAPAPLDVAVVAALEPLEDAQVQAVPAPVEAALQALLIARNLRPQALEQEQWEGAFTKGRTTRFRVAHAALASDADLVLVVEAFARYGSQLGGRYRWTVQVTASVAEVARPEEAVTRSFEVPVFLEHHHEREPEAVQAAVGVIERQVGLLVDQVLGGLSAE